MEWSKEKSVRDLNQSLTEFCQQLPRQGGLIRIDHSFPGNIIIGDREGLARLGANILSHAINANASGVVTSRYISCDCEGVFDKSSKIQRVLIVLEDIDIPIPKHPSALVGLARTFISRILHRNG